MKRAVSARRERHWHAPARHQPNDTSGPQGDAAVELDLIIDVAVAVGAAGSLGVVAPRPMARPGTQPDDAQSCPRSRAGRGRAGSWYGRAAATAAVVRLAAVAPGTTGPVAQAARHPRGHLATAAWQLRFERAASDRARAGAHFARSPCPCTAAADLRFESDAQLERASGCTTLFSRSIGQYLVRSMPILLSYSSPRSWFFDLCFAFFLSATRHTSRWAILAISRESAAIAGGNWDMLTVEIVRKHLSNIHSGQTGQPGADW